MRWRAKPRAIERFAEALYASTASTQTTAETLSDINSGLARIRDEFDRLGVQTRQHANAFNTLLAQQTELTHDITDVVRDLGSTGMTTSQRQREVNEDLQHLLQRLDGLANTLNRLIQLSPNTENLEQAFSSALRMNWGAPSITAPAGPRALQAEPTNPTVTQQALHAHRLMRVEVIHPYPKRPSRPARGDLLHASLQAKTTNRRQHGHAGGWLFADLLLGLAMLSPSRPPSEHPTTPTQTATSPNQLATAEANFALQQTSSQQTVSALEDQVAQADVECPADRSRSPAIPGSGRCPRDERGPGRSDASGPVRE